MKKFFCTMIICPVLLSAQYDLESYLEYEIERLEYEIESLEERKTCQKVKDPYFTFLLGKMQAYRNVLSYIEE